MVEVGVYYRWITSEICFPLLPDKREEFGID